MKEKKYAIRTDLRRSLSSKNFFIGVMGMFAAMLIGSFQDILSAVGGQGMLPSGFHMQIVSQAMQSDSVLLCVPIICALPYTSSVIDDFGSGYIRHYLRRCGKKEYVRAKTVAAGLSGGLSLWLGIFLCYLIFALVFSPMESSSVVSEPLSEMLLKSGAIETFGGNAQFLEIVIGKGVLFFFCGAFWSLVGLTLATGTGSRYMAYASPFILYYVLIILSERYLPEVKIIHPQEWLVPQQEWPGGHYGILLFLLELILLAAMAFSGVCRRRLRNE